MEARILKERFPGFSGLAGWLYIHIKKKEFEMRIKFIDSLTIGAGEFQVSEFQGWFIVEFAHLGGF